MPDENFIRLLLSDSLSFGPGKAELLEKIGELGSLQAAAGSMGMSYMKAWKLVKGLNAGFREPLVVMQRGGKDQGGAVLTATGKRAAGLYREAVKAANLAAAPSVRKLRRMLASDETNSSP